MEYRNTYYHQYGSHIIGPPGVSAHGVQPPYAAQPLCSQGTTMIRFPGPELLPGQQRTQVRAIMTNYVMCRI